MRIHHSDMICVGVATMVEVLKHAMAEAKEKADTERAMQQGYA